MEALNMYCTLYEELPEIFLKVRAIALDDEEIFLTARAIALDDEEIFLTVRTSALRRSHRDH